MQSCGNFGSSMQLLPASCFSAEKKLEAADDSLFVYGLQAMFSFDYCAANGEVFRETHTVILLGTVSITLVSIAIQQSYSVNQICQPDLW